MDDAKREVFEIENREELRIKKEDRECQIYRAISCFDQDKDKNRKGLNQRRIYCLTFNN